MPLVAVLAALVASALPAARAVAYPVPTPLPAGAPGQLISTEDLGPVTGGERYRVLYHSRSVGGGDIAVSGLVFVPSSAAPAAGRPIVAWAHGTTGTADVCAPSLGGYDPPYLDELLARGYVVAATDYEGLGTPGIHPYLVGESEGRGVLDAVRATLALPQASARNETVVFGHSQGGHAALFANELAPTYAPELHVLGTVAAAPASQIMAAWSIATSGPVVRAAVVMMGAGFHAAYPSLDLADVYTPAAIAKMGVVDTGCQDAVDAAYASMTQAEMIVATPDTVPAWRTAVAASEPGSRVGAGPVLIVHGTADEEVPYEATVSLSAKLCATGQQHELVTYPGETHGGIFGPGHDTMLGWIDARFAGAPAGDVCDGQHTGPLVPGPGECAPAGMVTPTGLDTIASPAVSQITTEATAMGDAFRVTATTTVEPGGTVTYVGTLGPDLTDLADRLLTERVVPLIRDQYGDALAKTAWVRVVLHDLHLRVVLPDGASPVGTPSVSGTAPAATASWSSGGLDVTVPELVLDSRHPASFDATLHWTLRDGGTPGPRSIELHAGDADLALTLDIGVVFFGSSLVGGLDAAMTCRAPAAVLAATSVVAAPTSTTTTASASSTTAPAPTGAAATSVGAATVAAPVAASPVLTG